MSSLSFRFESETYFLNIYGPKTEKSILKKQSVDTISEPCPYLLLPIKDSTNTKMWLLIGKKY